MLADLETNLTCDAACIYCFRNLVKIKKETVPWDIIKKRIINIINAGAKTINLIGGGEPLIYIDGSKTIIDVANYINSHGVTVEMFTNGLILGNSEVCKSLFGYSTKEVLNVLHKLNCTIFFKIHSFEEETYNKLIGKKVFHLFRNALNIFESSSYYLSNKPQLVIECPICIDNYSEIDSIWQYAKRHDLETSFELVRPSGQAKGINLSLSQAQALDLFTKISKSENSTWTPIPPYVGYSCNLNRFSCYVNVKGNLYNCESMAIKFGNIDKDDIRKLIKNSEEMQKVRKLKKYIKGKCSECIFLKKGICYGGCRGNAFETTGDFLCSDPMCWH